MVVSEKPSRSGTPVSDAAASDRSYQSESYRSPSPEPLDKLASILNSIDKPSIYLTASFSFRLP